MPAVAMYGCRNMVLIDEEHRSEGLVERTARRRVAAREQAHADELRRLVDAAYAVVARTGTLDPSVRAILAESGLSRQAFYRHVESKDELLLVMLDEGRRDLVDYLAHRIESVEEPCVESRIDAWVGGVLRQAADADAARRTKPFVAHVDRLAERFPDEQVRSEELLIAQVEGLLEKGTRAEAVAIYDLAIGALTRHLRRGTQPSESEVGVLASLAARLAADDSRGTP